MPERAAHSLAWLGLALAQHPKPPKMRSDGTRSFPHSKPSPLSGPARAPAPADGHGDGLVFEITEFLAVNASEKQDADRDHSDWIEIHNLSGEAQNVTD